MAVSGDHETHDDHDDRIGFASAASLSGRVRSTAPAETPLPAWARETPVAATAPDRRFGRRDDGAATLPEGALSLFAVYALILFAVPTLGVSALVGLAAVWRRELPEQDLAASHFLYQKRTLVAAGIAAVVGAVLILINLGVFVLFAMAVWVVIRGAVGVFRLKAGQPIPHPRGWWV